MSYRKGARAERELQARLTEEGFACVRVAGSGHQGDSPDLIAIKSTKVYAIECKFTSKDFYRISKANVAKLNSFCSRGGCKPVIAIKFTNRGWRFYEAEGTKFEIDKGRPHLFQTTLS
jgi:Holliday junction resolvase